MAERSVSPSKKITGNPEDFNSEDKACPILVLPAPESPVSQKTLPGVSMLGAFTVSVYLGSSVFQVVLQTGYKALLHGSNPCSTRKFGES
jgi:hypothetical protein